MATTRTLNVKVKRDAYCYSDPKLSFLGKRIETLQEESRELAKRIDENRLEIERLKTEQNERIAALTETPLHTQKIINRPNAEQLRTLRSFQKAMTLESVSLLETVYAMAREIKCHQTNWRSSRGENLDAAFLRVKREMESAGFE